MDNAYIHVAVAAVVNSSGEVLVSQRQPGTHLGGYWEFPGGKLEQGESIEAALHRELQEELDITPVSVRPLIRARYHYPEKSVLLDVWKVESFSGHPRGVEGQRIEWRAVSALDHTVFPPADIPIINALSLPGRYLITGEFAGVGDFQRKLSTALENGIRLVQLRLTHDWLQCNTESHVQEIIELCSGLCKQYSARLLFNIADQGSALTGGGIHLSSRQLLECANRPDCELVSASCHNRKELEYAQSIGADFAVLSPVQKTGSHPDAQPLGWDTFRELVDDINIPVYALGGMTVDDIERAWQHGGQGIAAIGAFWK